MPSQKLATIAAAGLVILAALPGATAAMAPPAVRRLARALPRPRALGATGFLLAALVVGAVLAFVFALSRADWRVLDLGPLFAIALALVLGVAHGCSGSGAAGRRRGGSPPRCDVGRRSGSALSRRARGARRGRARARGSARLQAVRDQGWGCGPCWRARASLTDHDGDGFSARFGGGDCDDHAPTSTPAPTTSPATASIRTARAATPRSVATGEAAEAVAPARRHGPRGDLEGQHPHRHDRRVPRRPPRRRRLRPAGRTTVAHADDRRARGARARTSARVVVAGAQHAALVPVDPHRAARRRASRGTSRGVNYPNLLPSNRTFFEVPRGGGAEPDRDLLALLLHALIAGSASRSSSGRTTARGTIAESNKDIASPRIVPRVIARLEQAAAPSERFVLWTHLFEPHSSYMAHKEFPTSSTGVPGLMEKYDYEIAFVDMWVGKLLDGVERARPRQGHGRRRHGRSRRGLGRAQGDTSTARISSTSSCACRSSSPCPGRAPRRDHRSRSSSSTSAPTLLDLVGGAIPDDARPQLAAASRASRCRRTRSSRR